MLCGLSTWLPVILRPLGSAYGRTKTGVKRIHMKNNLTIIYTYTRRIRHEYHHLIKATIRQSHNYDCIGRSVAYETYYFSPTHISSCLIPLDVLFQQNSVLIDSTPLQLLLSTTTRRSVSWVSVWLNAFPACAGQTSDQSGLLQIDLAGVKTKKSVQALRLLLTNWTRLMIKHALTSEHFPNPIKLNLKFNERISNTYP